MICHGVISVSLKYPPSFSVIPFRSASPAKYPPYFAVCSFLISLQSQAVVSMRLLASCVFIASAVTIIEVRMELNYDNPDIEENERVPLFSVGVLIKDQKARGYVNIHDNEEICRQFDLDLSNVGMKKYGRYEFYT